MKKSASKSCSSKMPKGAKKASSNLPPWLQKSDASKTKPKAKK